MLLYFHFDVNTVFSSRKVYKNNIRENRKIEKKIKFVLDFLICQKITGLFSASEIQHFSKKNTIPEPIAIKKNLEFRKKNFKKIKRKL